MYNEQNNDLNNKEIQNNSELQETFDQQHEYVTYGSHLLQMVQTAPRRSGPGNSVPYHRLRSDLCAGEAES